MNNKAVWIVVLLVVIAGAWYVMTPSGAIAPAPTKTETSSTVDATKPTDTTSSSAVTPVVADSAPAITIKGYAFGPATLKVKKGTTIVWTNADAVNHSVVADSGKWESKLLGQGETYSHEFTTAGTFAYHCGPHPYMKGTVEVTE